ncbi:MAG: DUF4003 family protein [Oscillospiraceae bacterium]|nr:DUF4003 family protein [Oscillospiraceae bacterium]
MTENLRNKCELFERNRAAIAKKFLFEKAMMSIAAGLLFTGADKEADPDRLTECRSILNRHTGVFSEYRDAVKLALISEMALSDDAERYIEDVKAVYQKLHKGHFVDNSYMILAAMLICDLGRQDDADAVIEKHNALMKQMEKDHPFLTDSEDISFVILLALSDRPVDAILRDMEEGMVYLKTICKVRVGSDPVQRLSEILALTEGDIREKCDKVVRLYDALQQNKEATEGGDVFASLGMLIGMEEEPEVIVCEILDAYAYLKDNKLFDDKSDGKKQRLMLAELLVADCYGTGAAMIGSAFISSALSVIRAQQIATIISVVSHVLPAVLNAAADQSSSETSEDTASTETDTDPQNEKR